MPGIINLKKFFCIAFGFSSGVVISGAVFAFIAIIGIVPRLAAKTNTNDKIKIYEEAIIIGGIFGTLTDIIKLPLPIGQVITAGFSFCSGIFFGCLAVSLAEVLDVIPILSRRVRVQNGIAIFVVILAIGKLIGSLVFFLVPGFH